MCLPGVFIDWVGRRILPVITVQTNRDNHYAKEQAYIGVNNLFIILSIANLIYQLIKM